MEAPSQTRTETFDGRFRGKFDTMNEGIAGWILDSSVSPDAKLAQGDLIAFAKEEDPLRKAGVIVTADCDLERRKHARLITLVPIVPVKILMEYYLLVEDCESKRSKIETYAFQNFSIESSHDQITQKALLQEAISASDPDYSNPAYIAAMFTLGHRLINRIQIRADASFTRAI